MNQGQFEAITSRLDRLIELFSAQRAMAIAEAEMSDAHEKATLAPHAESEPKPAAKPAKRSKTQ